ECLLIRSKIRISDLFACEIDFALLFWVLLNPHIFAKTLFSFQGTTCCFKTAFLFSQIHSLLSSTFFWDLFCRLARQRLLSY
ncbi:hypothetical protein, partial [Lactobacillus sp. W8173]|uniref:hypothetical protein n=1 Tax=Lactobacillus sp. W8173 TaxID=2751039 RepID=UPI001E5489D0